MMDPETRRGRIRMELLYHMMCEITAKDWAIRCRARGLHVWAKF